MEIGLIGAGLQGRRRARALKETGLGKLTIVADKNVKAGRELGNRYACQVTGDWKDVIQAKVDAIILCTPPNLRYEVIKSALHHGIHVLCEKPLAKSLREAKMIESLTRGKESIVKCGFNYRFHPGILQGLEWVHRGKVGRICFARCVHGIVGRLGYEKDWRTRPRISGGGELMDQGVHCIDLFRLFMGEFSEGFAITPTFYWGIPVEDNAFALLRTRKKQVASLQVSWTQWRNQFIFEVFGTDGYVTLEGFGGSYGTEKATLGKRTFNKPFAYETIEYRGADRSWEEEWRNFVKSISGDRGMNGSVHDGVRAIAVAEALYTSARKGRPTKIM
jgi:predicted dehydrogenase